MTVPSHPHRDPTAGPPSSSSCKAAIYAASVAYRIISVQHRSARPCEPLVVPLQQTGANENKWVEEMGVRFRSSPVSGAIKPTYPYGPFDKYYYIPEMQPCRPQATRCPKFEEGIRYPCIHFTHDDAPYVIWLACTEYQLIAGIQRASKKASSTSNA